MKKVFTLLIAVTMFLFAGILNAQTVMKTGGTTNIFPYLAYDDYARGTLKPADGKFGGAIYYDLNSNTFSQFVLGTDIKSAGSVSMFVKHSTDTYRRQYLSSEFGGFEVATSGSTVNNSIYASLPGNSLDDIGNVKPTTGVWHHIVATWDETAGDFLLYVDGALQPGSVSGVTVNGPDFTSSAIRIGQRHTINETDKDLRRNFDGGIDDLAFYSNVLTPAQITNIGANGAASEPNGQVALWKFDNAAGVAPIPSDFSASSTVNIMNDGSTELRPYLSFNQYEGARFSPSDGKFGGALFFDTPHGTTTFGDIKSADFDIKSAGSVSFFVKHDQANPMYRQQYISSHGANFEVAMHSSGRIYASTNVTALSPTTTISDNNWHHVVVTWDESTTELSCYLDGNLQLTKTGAVGPDFSQKSIRIGQRQEVVEYEIIRNLDGGIDDIAFYNKVLSASEIAQIAASGAFSLTSGLVAGFELDDPFGTTSVIAEPAPVVLPVNLYADNTLLSLISSHATIQEAVNAAADGNVIQVANGTYNENVTINKNITLISVNGSSSTIIDGNNAGSELGTIFLKPGRNGVTIGAVGQGFTIKGIDGAPGLEKAAVYLEKAQDNITIEGNTIEARGDHGLLGEYNAANNNITINNNEFSGQTFIGANPAGVGFSAQFSLPNVPRQLVVFGGGSGTTNTQNFTFTNNIISGIAGGMSITDNSGNAIAPTEQGNTLVTLDLVGTNVITGNTFSGTTARYAEALRARGTGTYTITENNFTGTYPGYITSNSNPITATCNWFGTTDEAVIASKIDPSITYIPFNISEGGECIGGLPIITNIGPLSPSDCGTLDVPVTVQNFYNVANISLTLIYDNSVLEFQSVSDIPTPLAGADATDFDGELVFARYSTDDEVTLGPDAVLFILHFNIRPAAAGGSFTNLTWSTVPGICEYSGGGLYPEVYSSTFNPLTVTIPNRPVKNIDSGREYCTIQEAIYAATAGDDLLVNTALHTEGPQIIVNKDINLSGLGKASTILMTSGNTGSAGDSRGWFLVNDGVEFNLSDLTLDGTGFDVYQGIRQRGFGTIDEVGFTEIKHPGYAGVAVAAFGTGNVDITNSTFSEIGRVGVLYFGAGVAGSEFGGNTFTGKGVGDWLDYGVEVGGGANGIIITGFDVSNNLGVADSDGSTSAGILVTSYYGPGTAANISDCDIHDNTTGIAVGYDASDASAVVAKNNKIYGNDYGLTSTNPVVDASPNWWGAAIGPLNDPENLCGSGNEVSANVTFRQWWIDEAMTVLSSSSDPVIDVAADITGTLNVLMLQLNLRYP